MGMGELLFGKSTTKITEKKEVTIQSESGEKRFSKKETVTEKDGDGKIVSQKTEIEETSD